MMSLNVSSRPLMGVSSADNCRGEIREKVEDDNSSNSLLYYGFRSGNRPISTSPTTMTTKTSNVSSFSLRCRTAAAAAETTTTSPKSSASVLTRKKRSSHFFLPSSSSSSTRTTSIDVDDTIRPTTRFPPPSSHLAPLPRNKRHCSQGGITGKLHHLKNQSKADSLLRLPPGSSRLSPLCITASPLRPSSHSPFHHCENNIMSSPITSSSHSRHHLHNILDDALVHSPVVTRLSRSQKSKLSRNTEEGGGRKVLGKEGTENCNNSNAICVKKSKPSSPSLPRKSMRFKSSLRCSLSQGEGEGEGGFLSRPPASFGVHRVCYYPSPFCSSSSSSSSPLPSASTSFFSRNTSSAVNHNRSSNDSFPRLPSFPILKKASKRNEKSPTSSSFRDYTLSSANASNVSLVADFSSSSSSSSFVQRRRYDLQRTKPIADSPSANSQDFPDILNTSDFPSSSTSVLDSVVGNVIVGKHPSSSSSRHSSSNSSFSFGVPSLLPLPRSNEICVPHSTLSSYFVSPSRHSTGESTSPVPPPSVSLHEKSVLISDGPSASATFASSPVRPIDNPKLFEGLSTTNNSDANSNSSSNCSTTNIATVDHHLPSTPVAASARSSSSSCSVSSVRCISTPPPPSSSSPICSNTATTTVVSSFRRRHQAPRRRSGRSSLLRSLIINDAASVYRICTNSDDDCDEHANSRLRVETFYPHNPHADVLVLIFAASRCTTDVVQSLLDSFANVNGVSIDNQTALHTIALRKRPIKLPSEPSRFSLRPLRVPDFPCSSSSSRGLDSSTLQQRDGVEKITEPHILAQEKNNLSFSSSTQLSMRRKRLASPESHMKLDDWTQVLSSSVHSLCSSSTSSSRERNEEEAGLVSEEREEEEVLAMARLLVQRGIEVDKKDNHGKTAVEYAHEQKKEKLTKLLLELGAVKTWAEYTEEGGNEAEVKEDEVDGEEEEEEEYNESEPPLL